jgi:SAM-dependent methyltransferase
MLDPVLVLRTVNRLLRPGGRLVIATPNANSFLRRCLRSWWNPLDVPRHVIVFSERSLRSAIDSAGFTSINTHTSSIVVERICGDSFAAILAPTHLPARAKWVIARLAGVVAQAVAAVVRADARCVGDELRAVALAGSRQQKGSAPDQKSGDASHRARNRMGAQRPTGGATHAGGVANAV